MRRTYRRKKSTRKVERFKVNAKITAPELRVIDVDGTALGIVPTKEAIAMATEKGLDLVEVSPKAEPPVAKILDYGKFQYEQEKDQQKQKSKQKKVEVKGIRLSIGMASHDRDFRINQAKKFIEDGHKAKIELVLRGRERRNRDLAKDSVNEFIQALEEKIPVSKEGNISIDKNRVSIIITAKK